MAKLKPIRVLIVENEQPIRSQETFARNQEDNSYWSEPGRDLAENKKVSIVDIEIKQRDEGVQWCKPRISLFRKLLLHANFTFSQCLSKKKFKNLNILESC